MIEAIEAFLELVLHRVSPASADLARCLDDLAAITHRLPTGDGSGDFADPPGQDYKATYAAIAARFPALGLYAVADPLSLDDGRAMIGDAIDDLADIAGDLQEVAWLWRNAGPEPAQWQFHLLYRAHWGQHLHALRLYLHARLVNT